MGSKFLTCLTKNWCHALTHSPLSPQSCVMPALQAFKSLACTQVGCLFILHAKCWVGQFYSSFEAHLFSITPWCHVTIQCSLSESRSGTAASKGLPQRQLGVTFKCISDYMSVNPHIAVITIGHETSFVPDFCSFMFAFGKNSKGFLKETFCHLYYRIW